jgi:hypothetical protein
MNTTEEINPIGDSVFVSFHIPQSLVEKHLACVRVVGDFDDAVGKRLSSVLSLDLDAVSVRELDENAATEHV